MQQPWERRQIIEVCICQQDNGWLWCCKTDGFDWLSRKTVSRENNTVEAKSKERARHIGKSAKESKHKYSNIQLNFGIFQKLADSYSGWSQSRGRRRSIRNRVWLLTCVPNHVLVLLCQGLFYFTMCAHVCLCECISYACAWGGQKRASETGITGDCELPSMDARGKW